MDSVGSKDYDLIKRVGFHMNHSSVLEHSLITFHVELSTKALLEFTRHRIGIAYTVTSSRYALDTMGIEFEDVSHKLVNQKLKELKDVLRDELKDANKKTFDQLAMLLPQAFMYKMQVSFNLRSLVHFLKLRTNKAAHYSIRKIAFEMIDVLPPEWQELVLLDEKINKNYKTYKEINNEK
jgi:thymidylate synthase (FAD)